jgi:hypothetical protein
VDGVVALLRAAEADASAAPGWSQLLIEFRVHACRDAQLNERYAALHRRTVEGIAGSLTTLLAAAGITPTVPTEEMARLVLMVGSGLVLERGADPAAIAPSALYPAYLRMLGLDHPSTSTLSATS